MVAEPKIPNPAASKSSTLSILKAPISLSRPSLWWATISVTARAVPSWQARTPCDRTSSGCFSLRAAALVVVAANVRCCGDDAAPDTAPDAGAVRHRTGLRGKTSARCRSPASIARTSCTCPTDVDPTDADPARVRRTTATRCRRRRCTTSPATRRSPIPSTSRSRSPTARAARTRSARRGTSAPTCARARRARRRARPATTSRCSTRSRPTSRAISASTPTHVFVTGLLDGRLLLAPRRLHAPRHPRGRAALGRHARARRLHRRSTSRSSSSTARRIPSIPDGCDDPTALPPVGVDAVGDRVGRAQRLRDDDDDARTSQNGTCRYYEAARPTGRSRCARSPRWAHCWAGGHGASVSRAEVRERDGARVGVLQAVRVVSYSSHSVTTGSLSSGTACRRCSTTARCRRRR